MDAFAVPNPVYCPHHHCPYYQHTSGHSVVFVLLVVAVLLVAAVLTVVAIRKSRRRRISGPGSNNLPSS